MYNQWTQLFHAKGGFIQKSKKYTGFIAELKLLAADSEFDAFLDQALCDIFAMGRADRETQRKLREVKQLTFAKAVDIAIARKSISRELSGTSNKRRSGRYACISSL